LETKICTKCGKELPIDNFYWRDKAKGLRRSECKNCHNNYVKQKYKERHDNINKIKSQQCCAKCGDSRFYVLDYHHINPDEKEEKISRLIAHNVKEQTLQEELNKCILLCANCHREFHYLQQEKNISIEEYLQ